jgi:hypothetical protein
MSCLGLWKLKISKQYAARTQGQIDDFGYQLQRLKHYENLHRTDSELLGSMSSLHAIAGEREQEGEWLADNVR